LWGEERAGFPVERGAQELLGACVATQSVLGSAMILWRSAEGAVASLLLWQSNLIQARLHLPGAAHVAARECNGSWLAWDDLGRVALFNPQNGRLEREWTLT